MTACCAYLKKTICVLGSKFDSAGSSDRPLESRCIIPRTLSRRLYASEDSAFAFWVGDRSGKRLSGSPMVWLKLKLQAVRLRFKPYSFKLSFTFKFCRSVLISTFDDGVFEVIWVLG